MPSNRVIAEARRHDYISGVSLALEPRAQVNRLAVLIQLLIEGDCNAVCGMQRALGLPENCMNAIAYGFDNAVMVVAQDIARFGKILANQATGPGAAHAFEPRDRRARSENRP